VGTTKGLTQNQVILQFLEHGNSVTHLDALTLFGCARLAARIEDLRSMGHNIITETIKQNGKSFARYHLVKGK
jgi:hypothetical protein